MGRRKNRPHRSGGIILDTHDAAGVELDGQNNSKIKQKALDKVDDEIDKPFFVEVDQSGYVLNEHFDISEVSLIDLSFSDGFSGYKVGEEFYGNSKFSLRFKMCNVNKFVGSIKLGHWPVLSASDIYLEFIEKCKMEDIETPLVIFSGNFDGPDDGVSGLVHLASLKFLTLRPILGVAVSAGSPSVRVRVEILKGAFDACESLLDNSRQLWKKSMMNVMAWLRPEVTTSETRYGVTKSLQMELDLHMEMEDKVSVPKKGSRFDPAGFYEAIMPSKGSPILENDIPDLLPELRPYQRRAASWMVEREKGASGSSSRRENSRLFSPLCLPVNFLYTGSKMFYNPFSGNVSLHPELHSPYIFGGILADEMGLGKTVELLACIFAHQKVASHCSIEADDVLQVTGNQKPKVKRLKRERVECICGAVSDSRKYKGLWVQCDMCDAWQHAVCVGYSPKRKSVKSRKVSDGQECRKKPTVNLQKHDREKGTTDLSDEEHICKLCLELIQVTGTPVATGATLVVCPAPILAQWHAEIIRHTKPGSLKISVYEGVRNTSIQDTSSMMDINALINSDIVLTTYDVLKDDLSHDSDRHEGDRRFMRFQKRYPVIPTPLTRIFWWRICLDEAQMVESNATAATEMALRLHCKHRWCITGTPIQRRLDDLYGLLRFVKASPFDVSRWWNEVICDPYERKDAGAMEFTHKLFKQIMWRSSKTYVADELQLPPQEECVSWLSFSPIEEHFYQRQHETCVSDAREVIESLKKDIIKREAPGCTSSDALSDIPVSHVEAGKLLNSLLKLRQACCHPQVGSSGLRSLQQSPMTMQEILTVLVGKTKIEGEEALRRLVLALNALAALAIIEGNLSQAVSLYREALASAEEHTVDFRLDPLLSIHIRHNLAEIILLASNQLPESSEANAFKMQGVEEYDKHIPKRQKISSKDSSDFLTDTGMLPDCASDLSANGLNGESQCYGESGVSSQSIDGCLRESCESLKKKYLSVFNLKLSLAQQEFRKSYVQVCDAYSNQTSEHTVWWLESLQHVEQNKDLSNELIRKIEEAVSGALNGSRASRNASCFRSISALKYHIQTRLDLLEASRQTLLDRLLEIDQTMENPREEDIQRVRYCTNCQANGDGPACVHCQLDELFQVHEARLFLLNKNGGITSAEEAIDLQKKKSALNRFYWNLSQQSKSLTLSSVENEELTRRRDVGEKVVVSKSPSELEIILGVIKSYCKAQLGREGTSAATRQVLLLEGMRKEYAHARSLARAQAQVLLAHDEIKMATSRLRLREDESDKSVDALSLEEIIPTSSHYSNEKFMSVSLLSCIKGKLRYLKGLVQSKQKLPSESPNSSCLTQETVTTLPFSAEKESECLVKEDEETCPVCQEKLSNQKMVFQCGHVTCCRCLFAMTEQRLVHDGKYHDKWIMCPTCRQHTDFGNIAYADDRHNNSANNSAMMHTFEGHEKYEAAITVQGSYGTKIEAVTRRILWIKCTDPKAKVLVFSSWNDVLDVLAHALIANNITHVRMKGGRKSQIAIRQFRGESNSSNKTHNQSSEPKFVQVLLLLIQHGANGLNLLEAQHVLLVEPLLNPAAEAQAISRVHRIGQENRTLVHRFIVKDTVEESIYNLNRSRNTDTFISGNTKNQDQPVLTLKDVDSLFSAVPPSAVPERDGSLMHLPPSVAAAIAAERRLDQLTK